MRLLLTAALLLGLAPAAGFAAEPDTTQAGPPARKQARLSAPT